MWLLGDNMKGQIEGPYLLINKGIMTFGEPFKDMCCAHAIFLSSVNQWILRYFALDFEKFSLSWANQDGEILPYATSLPSLLNKKMWLSLWKGVNKNMRWIWNTPPAAGPLAGKDIAFVSVGIQWFKSWLIHNICRDVLFQGDGLEFKRQFPKIKAQLKDIIERWLWRGLSQCVEMLGVICVPGQEYNRRTARASVRTVSRKWNPTK